MLQISEKNFIKTIDAGRFHATRSIPIPVSPSVDLSNLQEEGEIEGIPIQEVVRNLICVGDSGATVRGTSARHMYNLRTPATGESRLIVGSGEEMTVELIGDLDVVLHCDEDVVITLKDVAYIPGLWHELMSFNIIQESE